MHMTDLKELMRRGIEAYNAKDIGALASLYAHDAELLWPGRGVFKGRSAISSLYEEVDFKAFPDAKVSIDNQAISGNLVITEWSYGGTNTGQLTLADGSTAPATGKRVSGRGVNVAEYGEDGLIKSERFYFDLMELLVQLGLVPTAARP